MKTIVISKVFIVDQADNVLLLTRSMSNSNRPGESDIVGGHVESGEDILAAAARETAEEVSLDVSAQDLQLFFANTITEETAIIVRIFSWTQLADVKPIIAYSSEHTAYEWVTLEEAVKKLQSPSQILAAEQALKHRLFSEKK